MLFRSGARALDAGLVDSLGGPLEALAELRGRAQLADGERALVELHPRVAPFAGLRTVVRWVPGIAEIG